MTRSPGRAVALTEELRSAGATVPILPLIDFERARDWPAFEAALDRLSGGAYDWLVVTSGTTVLALQDAVASRGTVLSAVVPQSTRVAAVGPATRAALEGAGIPVTFVPASDRSAAGVIADWPAGECAVLLPQADLADGSLAAGIAAKGARVDTVTAYHTVDYPASHPLWTAGDQNNGESAVVEPEQARTDVAAGLIDAVVAASPSAARRIAGILPSLGTCQFVAIGPTTAEAAAAVGIHVAATADQPTPAGIVAALTALFATEGN